MLVVIALEPAPVVEQHVTVIQACSMKHNFGNNGNGGVQQCHSVGTAAEVQTRLPVQACWSFPKLRPRRPPPIQ